MGDVSSMQADAARRKTSGSKPGMSFQTEPKGFTLVELLLGLVITSMIGLTVAGASMVLSNAHFQSQQYYDCLQTARIAMRWIESDIRRSSLVTDVENGLMLWEGDTNGDGQINFSELTLITHDSSSGQVTRHRAVFPAGMSQEAIVAINTPFPLDQMVQAANSMALWMTSNAYVQSTTLATNVEMLDILPAQEPPMTTRLHIRLVVTEGGQYVTLRSAAKLRADRTEDVYVADGDYILTNGWPVDPNLL